MPHSPTAAAPSHDHIFLGSAHEQNERRSWIVIALCGVMMVVEIAGGLAFGSIALIADGLHMSTHAGALLLAALAYTFARSQARDPRFSFGTGKLGDLAGFTSAIVLSMIALLIAYEAVQRLIAPVPISFGEAIPIACLGLAVNAVSAWLLSGGHGHHHAHAHAAHDHAETHRIDVAGGALRLDIIEGDRPPHFRLASAGAAAALPATTTIETLRTDGTRQTFALIDRGAYLESADAIPEPHDFAAYVRIGSGPAAGDHAAVFAEHHGGAQDRDNNMRAAIAHVLADAAVSLLVIVGLIFARLFGWLWMDPFVGLIGALVIASWSYGLIRDTGAILLDMTPDRQLAETIRSIVEASGDSVSDLHLWRLGPGHLGAIIAITTDTGRDADFYRARLVGLPSLSHLTIEVTKG